MDEARAVLARLDRIEALDRDGASPAQLLAELRGLVLEAERWSRRERDERAVAVAGACRDALAAFPPPGPPLTTSLLR